MKTYISKEDVENIAISKGKKLSIDGESILTSLDGIPIKDLHELVNLAIAKVIGEPVANILEGSRDEAGNMPIEWRTYPSANTPLYAIKELPND